ncbi:MAG TPA: ABC transporter permease, partial [Vicinamibacterales bacterium]|nr:ABC transporter permease [Vicinamibacterales bacterium]
MTRWRVLAARLREVFTRGRIARDLDDELRHHLDLLTEQHLARGLSPAEARRAARLEFGSLDATAEAVRDRRGFRVLETIGTDLRRAVRRLAASPGLTASVVTILGLGIGVNLAIYSLVYAAMLRPLPYADPDRLVAVWETMTSPSGETEPIAVAPANLADYREQAGDLATMAGYARVARNVTGAATPDRLVGEAVMPGYFDVLGGVPRLGRTFAPGEYVEGNDAVVVLSESLWRTGFGGDTAVVGRRLALDGRSHEIVGVLPDSFVAVSTAGTPDRAAFYIPLVYPPDMMTGRGEHLIRVVGRLAPGTSVAALDAALAATASTIAATEERAAGLGAAAGPLVDHIGSVDRSMVRVLMAVLLGAVALVLVATCANVASLLLVRSFGRTGEVAVRVALGASRARLRLEWFAESLVLAALGAAAGIGFGIVAMRLLIASAPAGIPNLETVALDGQLLAIALVVALGTALVIGFGPAWHVGRTLPADALRSESRTTAGQGVGRVWTTLLFAEVVVSALLLVGAGLMTRSLMKLNAVELGFDPDDVLALNVPLPVDRYATGDARLAFFEEAARRLRALPGVEAVAFANRLPLRGNWVSGFFLEPAASQAAATTPLQAGFQAVNPDYFPVLRIGAIAGRLIEPGDRTGAPAVAVV